VTFRIAIAQINLLVGDIQGNAEKILAWSQRARDESHADLIVFPELTLTGYPPEDLILRPQFMKEVDRALTDLTCRIRGICAVIGFPEKTRDGLYNGAAVIKDGQVTAIYHKQDLPNYGVFDEKRYFRAGTLPSVIPLNSYLIGITICEDIWSKGPVEATVVAGAEIVVNLNASPYQADKEQLREQVVRQRIAATGVPLVYANLVGGQDELVFDGSSFVMDGLGFVTAKAVAFEEELLIADFERSGNGMKGLPSQTAPLREHIANVYQALVLGIRDYVGKNGFKGAVLGLSGGIDSALVLALAVDALGAEKVEVVSMPSRYTADMSNEDARLEADALGVAYHVIPIEPAFQAFTGLLAPMFEGLPRDTTEENIQARCRGVLLMAISNKSGKIVLTTGNKSEMSVGYATLYGDMAGGFAPLKDVPKLLVYQLCEYRNRLSPVIPQRVIDRPPSAELAPDQKDEDSLPPYSVLDPILERYVELDQSVEDIIAAGFAEVDVKRVARLVDRNEYKRRQAPPGVKISRRAFGRDRRYPITRR
jgi:NAD+ synthase (glutamine-hydrolysing)